MQSQFKGCFNCGQNIYVPSAIVGVYCNDCIVEAGKVRMELSKWYPKGAIPVQGERDE